MSSIRDLLIHVGVDGDTSKLRQFDQGVSHLKTGMIALTAVAAGAAYGINKLFQAGAAQEMTMMSFETMLGSASAAKNMIADLRKLSLETPFKFEEAESTVKMMIAMGAAEKDVIQETRMMGDVAAGLNIPMARLALNFGQVRSLGRLMGREIRDFSAAGVPLLEVLGKSLGKTKAEITKMASQGQISFEQTKEAFMQMTGEGGKFDNLMIKAAKTAKGLASNVGVLFDLALRDIGTELNDNILKDLLQNFYDWGLQNDNIKKGLKSILYVIAGIGGAFALWGLGQVLYGVSLVTAAITGLGTASMIATGKALLLPLAVGAAFLVLLAIAQDIWYTFENPKNKTVLRELINILNAEFPDAFDVISKAWDVLISSMSMAASGIGLLWATAIGDEWQKEFWTEQIKKQQNKIGDTTKSSVKNLGNRPLGMENVQQKIAAEIKSSKEQQTINQVNNFTITESLNPGKTAEQIQAIMSKENMQLQMKMSGGLSF